MNLRLLREPSQADTTFGILLIDGFLQCYTLENSHKIIPLGHYPVTKYYSPKNKREVPLLENVPNRSMIEIHVANWFHELEGCIAVGNDISTRPMLTNSNTAFSYLMTKLIFKDLVIQIDYL
jgi:hypothetical protein